MKIRKIFVITITILLLGVVLYGVDKMASNIRDVKAKHEEQLMQLPGVVSIGIGKDEAGKTAIIVGLDRPRPDTEAQIPQHLEGHPVIVQTVGPVQAQ